MGEVGRAGKTFEIRGTPPHPYPSLFGGHFPFFAGVQCSSTRDDDK